MDIKLEYLATRIYGTLSKVVYGLNRLRDTPSRDIQDDNSRWFNRIFPAAELRRQELRMSQQVSIGVNFANQKFTDSNSETNDSKSNKQKKDYSAYSIYGNSYDIQSLLNYLKKRAERLYGSLEDYSAKSIPRKNQGNPAKPYNSPEARARIIPFRFPRYTENMAYEAPRKGYEDKKLSYAVNRHSELEIKPEDYQTLEERVMAA